MSKRLLRTRSSLRHSILDKNITPLKTSGEFLVKVFMNYKNEKSLSNSYYKLTVASPILEDADAFPVVIDKFAILSIFVKATIRGVS